MGTDLIERHTLSMMVDAFDAAIAEVNQAYTLLDTAKKRLRSAYTDVPGYRFDVIESSKGMSDCSPAQCQRVVEKLKRDAWSIIVEKMQLRRLLSIARRDELDKQLREGDLPDLTDANILAMLQESASNVNKYLEDAVLEVYDFLRPPGSKLKTNTEFDLGKKVILSYMVERRYSGGRFYINYHRAKWLTALDNVFSLLDGKGPVKEHYGPLYGAIEGAADGTGATDYFKFKACQNGNLHLEFLRPDLVAKLNALAGGSRLKGGM